MGKLEQELKAEVRRTKINKAIIAAVAVAGGLAVAAVAPNIFSVIGKIKYFKQRKYQLKSSLSRLIHKGYLVIESEGGRKFIKLTPKGKRFAALMGEGSLVPKKPKRWDGKWRMLVFDIPETRRKVRTQIRLTLLNLGFYRLQDSVWVYPYDCEDFITVAKADMKIGKDLLYVIADKVENDLSLRTHFKLQSHR